MIETVSKYCNVRKEELRKDPILGGYTGPVGFEWKHPGGNAGMVPDRGFRKQLKKLDEELEVVWDWGKDKWEIWRLPKEEGRLPVHMLTVETQDKKYRELGADVLLKLQQCDPQRYGSVEKILAYLEEVECQHRRRVERDFRNKIEAAVSDTFNFARGVLQVQVPRKILVAEAVKNERS